MTYRPPGRSHRAGRAQADNDIFEGLPVKQWGQSIAHISLAPPKSEIAKVENDKWGDLPMPRDYQLLSPWTQQLLRMARSGKTGNKRKPDPDSLDDDKQDDEAAEDSNKSTNFEDRGYVAKKWKPVPEALLEPEHKHFEFLAKRRKGLPNLYAPELHSGTTVPMRKTKVQKVSAEGEITIYDVLVPEGQTVEGEVAETTELADIKPVAAVPGTVIEGVGIANDEGVVVAEHLKPAAAPRRNRPPPKKKGGPGRGKKRVTFTNPDGSTYTTIVPNATKIVPQPGQTVTHVAKGEEAKADITAEQAAAQAAQHHPGGNEGEAGEEGEGSDEEGEEGDDDDDREDGELSEDATSAAPSGAPSAAPSGAPSAAQTPVPPSKAKFDALAPIKTTEEDVAMEDDAPAPVPVEASALDDLSAVPVEESVTDIPAGPVERPIQRETSNSPDLPLANASHSRSGSIMSPPPPVVAEAVEPPVVVESTEPAIEAAAAEAEVEAEVEVEVEQPAAGAEDTTGETEIKTLEEGDEDLPGNLEKPIEDEREDQVE